MKLYVPDGKGGREELKVLRGDPGPQGDPGPPGKPGNDGKPGTTTWAGITGKPAKFTPDSHEHTTADITDLPQVSDTVSNETIVKRSEIGTIRAADPQGPNNVATQRYVDAEVGKKADATHSHSEYASRVHYHSEYATKGEMNSLFRLVSSPPSYPTTGVLYLVAE